MFTQQNGNPNIYSAVIGSDFCEGFYDFTEVLEDEVGNTSETLSLPTQLSVDNSAPQLVIANKDSLEDSSTVFSYMEGYNSLTLHICSDEDVLNSLNEEFRAFGR